MGSFRSAMLCEQSGQDKDYIEHVKKRAREHKFKFKGHNMIYMILHVYYLGGASEMGVRNCTRKFLTATHLGRQIAQRRLHFGGKRNIFGNLAPVMLLYRFRFSRK